MKKRSSKPLVRKLYSSVSLVANTPKSLLGSATLFTPWWKYRPAKAPQQMCSVE